MLDTSRQIKTSQHFYSFNYNSIAQLLLRPCFGDHYPGKESNRWLKLVHCIVTLVEGCTPTGVTPTVQSGAKHCKVGTDTDWRNLFWPNSCPCTLPLPLLLHFSFHQDISPWSCQCAPDERRLIFSNGGTVVWMEGPSVDKFMSPCPCAGCRFYIFNGSI